MTIHSSGKVWDEDVRKAAVEIDGKFPRNDWTSTYPGHGENSAVGAYAVDFMISSHSTGQKIAEYAWKNRKRLGIRYVIWNGQIISETSSQPNRWVRYFGASSSNPSVRHTNHVHVSFYTNAKFKPNNGLPSEKDIFVDKLAPGVKNSDSVRWLQYALTKLPGDQNVVKITGNYDKATVESVKIYQAAKNDDIVDGDIGKQGLIGLLEDAKLSGFTIEDEA